MPLQMPFTNPASPETQWLNDVMDQKLQVFKQQLLLQLHPPSKPLSRAELDHAVQITVERMYSQKNIKTAGELIRLAGIIALSVVRLAAIALIGAFVYLRVI